MFKFDLADRFYGIDRRPADASKLGLVFPGTHGWKQLVAIPLTIPMGCKNSPTLFCAAIETISNVANDLLRSRIYTCSHKLNTRVEDVAKPPAPSLRPNLAALQQDFHLHRQNSCLLSYVEIFLNDFLDLEQGPTHRCHTVRWALFHAINAVFITLNSKYGEHFDEVLFLKNINAGDLTWLTCQVLLGWIVDSVNLTMNLPPYRAERLKEILGAIPPAHKRVVIIQI